MECIIDGMLRNGARRAIIPGVGAFIRKESGEVIFSDLLRCDDGAMAAYLVEHEGITPAMAQERTRAYAGRVQAELTRSGRVEFSRLGHPQPDGAGPLSLRAGQPAGACGRTVRPLPARR